MRKYTKKIALVCTMTALMASMTACSKSSSDKATDSSAKVYTGTATGMGGDVVVDVTIDGDKITKVEVTNAEKETPGISDPAVSEMPQKFIDAQGTDVDTVSGCTVTSTAIKEAVEAALTEAGFNK